MDWSTDEAYIRIGTDNYKTLLYAVPSATQVSDESLEKFEWNQWTSIFGPEVIGIWPSSADKNFINCAHLANCDPMKLATGDDDGEVKLFNFPCTQVDVKFEFFFNKKIIFYKFYKRVRIRVIMVIHRM